MKTDETVGTAYTEHAYVNASFPHAQAASQHMTQVAPQDAAQQMAEWERDFIKGMSETIDRLRKDSLSQKDFTIPTVV